MIELISVHVPKCAGTSLRLALERAYGPASVHGDYADRPLDPAAPMHLDPDGFFGPTPVLPAEARVVHGHFHIRKYRTIRASIGRIAFLRHPVARAVSHYDYWNRLAPAGHALHAYMRERRLDLPAFVRLPFIRRLYRRVLFAGVSRREFDLIGTTETLAADLARLSALLGKELVLPVENAAEAMPALEPALAAELARLLTDEIAFYESWRGG